MEADARKCRLCAAPSAKTYTVREMMLGTRDRFEYSECGSCGALQRVDVELDVGPYYPSTYYAFAVTAPSRPRAWVRIFRSRIWLSPSSPFRAVLRLIWLHPMYEWVRRLRPTVSTRILDVGCGRGRLLRQLSEAGYTSLAGLDPFLPPVVETPPAVRLIRASLEEADGEFDLIMLHHALEHIPDQQSAMRAIARLLPNGGCCLIRVPTVSSYAWEHYHEDWFQIDAPRHCVLHSIESLRRLGEASGLVLEHLEFDSTELQILWSEQYRNDVPMSVGERVFSRGARREARALARRLNVEGCGDQVAAYFRKPKRATANTSQP
jgi:SAM-dependent methyltransferase